MCISRLVGFALVLGAISPSGAAEAEKDAGAWPETGIPISLPGHPLGIAWGFVYGQGDVPAAEFLPGVRALGAGFSKVYLFWEQLEPRRGEYDWSALDAYVNQLRTPDEGLVAIFSASSWATEVPATLLPPSPARDLEDYRRFIHAAVSRVRGRVRYWQNDCEPNSPVYWAGTKEQFVAQLRVFHQAVKEADPAATVIVGGYDGLFHPPEVGREFPEQARGLAFFDYVLREAGDAFDVFDLRLYFDPYTITGRVAHIRAMMRAAGREHPIICTEYNGPGFFEFVPNRAHVALISRWTEAAATPEGPERDAAFATLQHEVAALYARMAELPPETQMFLEGCAPELDAKLRRMQGRDLVMRNLFALAAGVQKTVYWDFWHDTQQRDDMMTVMYGKLKLMERDGDGFVPANPTTAVMQRLGRALEGVERVVRRELPEHPDVMWFEVVRRDRPALQVAWERRDVFAGEEQPSTRVTRRVSGAVANSEDIFGEPVPCDVQDGELTIALTDTPVFLEFDPRDTRAD